MEKTFFYTILVQFQPKNLVDFRINFRRLFVLVSSGIAFVSLKLRGRKPFLKVDLIKMVVSCHLIIFHFFSSIGAKEFVLWHAK